MSLTTRTSSLLLLNIADPANQAAWAEFDQRYRPILAGFARGFGLQEPDADDVAQETLLRVLKVIRAGAFDHSRGRLRAWLFTIARTRMLDARRKSARRLEARGESALIEQPDDAAAAMKRFDEAWQSELLKTAFLELRNATHADPRTLRLVELLLVEERSATDVARELGMEVNAVYVAKHRALGRLRKIVARLQEEF